MEVGWPCDQVPRYAGQANTRYVDEGQSLEFVENAHALSVHFGHWPSFHDAEIRAIRFANGPAGDSLEIEVEVIELTDRVDLTGHFVPRAMVRATLQFARPTSVHASDLGPQNVLEALHIRRPSGTDVEFLGRPDWGRHLFVEFEPIGGFATLRFFCDAVSVHAVRAIDALRAAT